MEKSDIHEIDILTKDENTKISEKSLVKVYEKTLLTSTKLSLKAQRLLRIMLTLIQPTDNRNKVYSFNVSDYQKVFQVDEYSKKQLNDAAKELHETRELPNEDPEGFTISGLISYLTVKNGVAYFEIPAPLFELYSAVKQRQQYILGNTKGFQCSYSFAFYELFLLKLSEDKEHPNGTVFTFSIDKLRKWLRIEDKYIDKRSGKFAYGSFKSKVLQSVYDDLNNLNKDKDKRKNKKPIESNCNINFEFKEITVGRQVVKLEFIVRKVHLDNVEEPKINAFYEGLQLDTKMYYDSLIALRIRQAEIEKSIQVFGEETFCEICKYISTCLYKGRAYVSAILRNGITDPKYTDAKNFLNIEKSFDIFDNEREYYDSITSFLISLDSKNQKKIYSHIKSLMKEQPEIYRYIADLSLNDLLNTKDLKIFVIERIVDILKTGENKDIVQLYQKYADNVKSNNDLWKDRQEIIDLFEKFKINKTIWPELLSHSDEYIKDKIKYCEENYKSFTPGLIVKAIRNDYQTTKISKKESNPKKEKIAEAVKQEEEKVETLKQAVSVYDDPEFKEAYSDFMENASEEEHEELKNETISKLSSFGNSFLKRQLKKGELKDYTLKQLIKYKVFQTQFLTVFKEKFWNV